MSIIHTIKQGYVYILILYLTLCNGCHLHLQRLDDYPATLSTVYIIQPSTFDYGFTQEFSRFFRGMQAKIVKSPSLSPVTIKLSDIDYTSKSIALNSSSNAISTTYCLHVTVSVLNKQRRTILGPKTFSITQTISQNTTIINTSSQSNLIYAQLRHTVIPNIIAWLTSGSVQTTLQTALELSHDH